MLRLRPSTCHLKISQGSQWMSMMSMAASTLQGDPPCSILQFNFGRHSISAPKVFVKNIITSNTRFRRGLRRRLVGTTSIGISVYGIFLVGGLLLYIYILYIIYIICIEYKLCSFQVTPATRQVAKWSDVFPAFLPGLQVIATTDLKPGHPAHTANRPCFGCPWYPVVPTPGWGGAVWKTLPRSTQVLFFWRCRNFGHFKFSSVSCGLSLLRAPSILDRCRTTATSAATRRCLDIFWWFPKINGGIDWETPGNTSQWKQKWVLQIILVPSRNCSLIKSSFPLAAGAGRWSLSGGWGEDCGLQEGFDAEHGEWNHQQFHRPKLRWP